MRLLLVAHVDTVFNRGEAAKRPFKVDANGFAWGPGVGDDKATVVEVIYGLQALKEAGFTDFKEIIYYTNGEEEGGSPMAEDIVAELSQQADFAVIMDVARPNWGIVTQRKGNAKYIVKVTGIGGHHGAMLPSIVPTLFTSWLTPLPSCINWPAPCQEPRPILRLKLWLNAASLIRGSSFPKTLST